MHQYKQDCLYWRISNVLYRTCKYNRLTEDESLVSKHVADIKNYKF
jgi:hypothetical protein